MNINDKIYKILYLYTSVVKWKTRCSIPGRSFFRLKCKLNKIITSLPTAVLWLHHHKKVDVRQAGRKIQAVT